MYAKVRICFWSFNWNGRFSTRAQQAPPAAHRKRAANAKSVIRGNSDEWYHHTWSSKRGLQHSELLLIPYIEHEEHRLIWPALLERSRFAHSTHERSMIGGFPSPTIFPARGYDDYDAASLWPSQPIDLPRITFACSLSEPTAYRSRSREGRPLRSRSRSVIRVSSENIRQRDSTSIESIRKSNESNQSISQKEDASIAGRYCTQRCRECWLHNKIIT
jgi:hypothetical protein